MTLPACATIRADAPLQPDYSEVPTDAAPPAARYYADCFAQAIDAGAYRRADNGNGDEWLLFTCTGEPARVFFEALASWSRAMDSEFMMGDRVTRSTARVRQDLYGTDYCSARDGQDHRCVISFNAGDFIRSD
ncbi:MAG: hypothetical protein J0L52_06330 [Caulobacterales bacterium]|nr:hypothetical protein [Caulobacterales bacterium]